MQQELTNNVIKNITTKMTDNDQPIDSLNAVQQRVKEEYGLQVSKYTVSCVLKKEMGLGYRRTKSVHYNANRDRTLVLR